MKSTRRKPVRKSAVQMLFLSLEQEDGSANRSKESALRTQPDIESTILSTLEDTPERGEELPVKYASMKNLT